FVKREGDSLGSGGLDAIAARKRTIAAGNGAAANGSSSALTVTGIEKSFGGVRALAGFDMTVPRGRILGIIGANGAGKTTAFDVISGFLAPDGGDLTLEGTDITDKGPARRGALGLGRTFQDVRLFPALTVAESIAVALERHVEVRDPVLLSIDTGSAIR